MIDNFVILAGLLAFVGVIFGLWFVLRGRFSGVDSDAVIGERLRRLQEDKVALEVLVGDWQGRYELEKEKRLVAEEQVRQKDSQMADWQVQRERFMEAAKASALQSLNELSSKLLSDHKLEGEVIRKESEKKLFETTRDLREHFAKIMGMVADMEGRVGAQGQVVSQLQQILTESAKLGQAYEVILENVLKGFGLRDGQDFLLQGSFSHAGGRLRPDAVIFLPDDYIVVVDSKASVLLNDLAMRDGVAGGEGLDEHSEQALLGKVRQSMRRHVRNLSGKEYLSAIEKGVKVGGQEFRPKQVITLLWLARDGAVELARRADKEIVHWASEKGIFIVGPSALQSAIGIAALKISAHRQSKKQALIAKETGVLLQYVTSLLTHAEKVGRGLRAANSGFDSLVASANRRLLPKARRLVGLGVSRPSGGFGKPLQSLSDDTQTIEMDTSETDTSETDTSETDTSETDTSETDTSETDTSKTDTSETDTSETDTSEEMQGAGESRTESEAQAESPTKLEN